MKSKKLMAIGLVLTMSIAMVGCGQKATPVGGSAPAAPAQTAEAPAEEKTDAAATEEAAKPADGAVTGEKQGQTVLKCSFNQSAENPEAEAVRRMSDALYDATEGRYSIEVYPNELLGNQKDSLASVQAGAIDMAIVANSLVEGVNPDFAVIGTPYMFDTIEHQERLFTNGNQAIKDLFATTSSAGFRVLTAFDLGPRNLYTRDGAVTNPEELSGMKIRVMQSDTMIQMMNLMGGVGTPMSQGDVYTAIQTGTLDGAENNIITFMDLNQFEVAKYYNLSGHLMIPDEVIISNLAYDQMSDADKAALEKVALEATTTAFQLCEELRDSYEQKALDAGVTITEVDITPFQDACQELIDKNANLSETTKAVYEEILKCR